MTFPDGGRSYLSKVYDDNWMIQYGFIERRAPVPSVGEVVGAKDGDGDGAVPELVVVDAHKKVGAAIDLMQRYGISQLPVARHETADELTDIVGSISERSLLDRVFRNPDALNDDVAVAMQPPLATVDAGASVDEVFAELTGSGGAVVVGRAGKPVAIITRSDLLEFLAARRTHVDA
jgi:cystathionine beta-synthase